MLTAAIIVEQIGITATIIGNAEVVTNKVHTLEEADALSLICVVKNKPAKEAIIDGVAANVIFCDPAMDTMQMDTKLKTLILTPDIMLYFL